MWRRLAAILARQPDRFTRDVRQIDGLRSRNVIRVCHSIAMPEI
ncbi:hypothetical protein FHR38_005821 [Micromonospora polyrhachis]|uniref:Uncharacterized protein n=1 Tax=Micromonospora polyrhachis TaxID=1282883 RepID=A0A7W7WT48_9ACTN|nr:hypothetical protein [Micromonospora polyrhachis]